MDLEALIGRLIRGRVEFVLIGGFAAAAHGDMELLAPNLEICFRCSWENLNRFVRAIADLHPRHRKTAPRLTLEISDQSWEMFKKIYVETDLGVVDCFDEVVGVGKFDEAFAASEELTISVGTFRILTLDALIRAKLAAGREHDLKTVGYLNAIEAKRGRPIDE